MGIFNHKTTNPYISDTNSYNKYFFITAYYKKSKDTTRLFINEISSYQIIPYKIILNEISCYFYESVSSDYNISLIIKVVGSKSINQKVNTSLNARRQNFPINIQLEKNDILWVEIYKKGTNTPIIHNNAVFSIVFRDKFD